MSLSHITPCQFSGPGLATAIGIFLYFSHNLIYFAAPLETLTPTPYCVQSPSYSVLVFQCQWSQWCQWKKVVWAVARDKRGARA